MARLAYDIQTGEVCDVEVDVTLPDEAQNNDIDFASETTDSTPSVDGSIN